MNVYITSRTATTLTLSADHQSRVYARQGRVPETHPDITLDHAGEVGAVGFCLARAVALPDRLTVVGQLPPRQESESILIDPHVEEADLYVADIG